MPNLIPQGIIVLGILTVIGFIKAMGHVIDAVTDPLIAAKSDRSQNRNGRRIPMMKWAAVPFGVCALLIFCVPFSESGIGNAVWIAVFMWGYYLFYTIYMIPHTALIPEMVQNENQRVNTYTWSSFFLCNRQRGRICCACACEHLERIWTERSIFMEKYLRSIYGNRNFSCKAGKNPGSAYDRAYHRNRKETAVPEKNVSGAAGYV